jgi:iron-regulated transporter 1
MATSNTSITTKLYTSHALSAWNSRTFEFGAILFLASIYPGTLLYASIYALLRSLAATLFSSRVGSYIDKTDRLVSIRHGILWQRVSVIASCGLFWVMLELEGTGVIGTLCFGVVIGLACVEKLASLGTTVAVERDWVVVICEDNGESSLDRGAMNAGMRRIDLFCKLVAPVFISFLDAMMGTEWAVGVTLALSAASVGIEYWAIAKVYHAVPALTKEFKTSIESNEHDLEGMESEIPTEPGLPPRFLTKGLADTITPWLTYLTSPAFLPSLSLSLLYLTVLSTGPHWQTYLLATSYTPLTVSLLRVLAVVSELAATIVAPYLMDRIGPIRSGLWSINWQAIALAPAVGVFYHFSKDNELKGVAAGAILTAGMIASRLGLWSFDLSVQFLVQEHTSAETRAVFSSCEVALQNFFELLSFAATIAFPEPSQFAIPVLVSFGAVVSAAVCFAAYVRRERGHLLHASKCLGYEKKKGYDRVEQVEMGDLESEGRGEGAGQIS